MKIKTSAISLRTCALYREGNRKYRASRLKRKTANYRPHLETHYARRSPQIFFNHRFVSILRHIASSLTHPKRLQLLTSASTRPSLLKSSPRALPETSSKLSVKYIGTSKSRRLCVIGSLSENLIVRRPLTNLVCRKRGRG